MENKDTVFSAVLSKRDSGFYFYQMENIDPHAEKQIAKQAVQMLQTAMRSKISSLGFQEHLTQGKGKLAEATAIAKTKLGNAGPSQKKIYFNSLSLKMGRHGFVQHYGANGTRENIKGRTRTKPRQTQYNFKNHLYKLPAKDYIDVAIKNSGVIDYVLENVTRIRAEEVFVNLKTFIEK